MRPYDLATRVGLVILLQACGPARGPATVESSPLYLGTALGAPAPVPSSMRGAAYLTSVAAQLQPPWAQFLEDCRQRLPATHALNVMTRQATIELVIDRAGRLTVGALGSSGDADFDRAVRGITVDATLIPPPPDLLGDDDRLHLRWLFARDGRQAGPASAAIVEVQLPVREVVARRLERHDLGGAARRVLAAAATDPGRGVAAERVMVATLRAALESPNSPVRRESIEAIGRARVVELAPSVRAAIAPTGDLELRLVATAATAALEDREAVPALLAQLATDLNGEPRLALGATAALVKLAQRAAAATVIASALATGARPTALHAYALAPTEELAPKLAGWFARGDARVRAAVCAAIEGTSASGRTDRHAATLARGLGDADAMVRAICVDVVARRQRADARMIKQVRELARDRDRAVRARAVAALVSLAPSAVPNIETDGAPEVRAAFAAARPQNADPRLRALAGDPDAEVRAAALAALGTRAPELAARGASDPAWQVRRAAVASVTDEAILERLAGDAAPEVATDAAIRLAAQRGREAMTAPLLERVIAGPPASAGLVRAVLAWLLAR